MWYAIFLLVVVGAFYLVNWVALFPGPTVVKLPVVGYVTIPQIMIDVFLVLVFIIGALQWIGVGRGQGFPVPK
jgi:hypothetical protein